MKNLITSVIIGVCITMLIAATIILTANVHRGETDAKYTELETKYNALVEQKEHTCTTLDPPNNLSNELDSIFKELDKLDKILDELNKALDAF